MNKEEATRLLPRVKLAYGTANFTRDSYTACEWFETVEKALKQEPKTDVLDKIIAEIKTEYDSIPRRNTEYDDGWVEALEWVLDDVIGKYRAESEEAWST